MGKQLNLPFIRYETLDPTSIANSLAERLPGTLSVGMAKLTGKRMVFSNYGSTIQPMGGWPSEEEMEVKEFPAVSQPCPIAAIDSSCISVADTEDGSIYAARVAVAFFFNREFWNYLRIGPLIFHLNGATLSNTMVEKKFPLSILMRGPIAQQMIRVTMERAMAIMVTGSIYDGIVLLDGSLRRSVFDVEGLDLREVLEGAEENRNTAIGVSKTSKQRLLGKLSSALYSSTKSPAYLDVHPLISPFLKDVLGRVLLVRFADDGLVFRVDVARSSSASIEDALSKVRGNDGFFRGYPESLRVAHHLCHLTSTDDASIRGYLTKKVGMVELPAEDPRRTVLGSYKVRSLRRVVSH